MGTWGSGILEDDVARDVYDRYLQQHATGQPADAIIASLRQDFADVASDPDEGPVFWLAVAQAQWDCSQITAEVRARVEEIIAQGLGLARWAEAGARELAQRRAALERFAAKIQTPRKRPLAPARQVAPVPFAVGDCLAIDLGTGEFGAAVVTKYLAAASASSHILSILDFCEPTPPAEDQFNPPSWLRVTETPDVTIVKYDVYATGYRSHRSKYRVVCHIDVDNVPPPLTLTLANWGNMWRDLAKRLGH